MPALFFDRISPVLRSYLSRYGFGPDCSITLAGTAGSRREYYRIAQRGLSFVVLVSPADDADFGRFLRITQFYRLMRFPVPMVHCIDDAERQVLLEDLGDRRLFDQFTADRDGSMESYRKSLDLLVDLQTRCHASHLENPDIRSRIFDREQLLWETSYYRGQYLEGFRGLPADPAWEGIFSELATVVDKHPKAIMHRDFQSQNLMVTPDGVVHVIDYQGSRLGSIYYDLASILLDPYVMLTDTEIESLLRHFHAKSLSPLSFGDFRKEFLHTGMQRVMQALGAYCFLSRVKGLTPFAAHIGPGEQRLRWLLRQVGRDDWMQVLP